MATSERVARISMRQAIWVTILSGVFGLLGGALQFYLQRPAQIRDIDQRLPLPVGTIVASMLKPSEFAQYVGDPGDFGKSTSTWVPADGREVDGSTYAKATSGQVRVPDLRGMFLRGLNYSYENNVRTGDWADPELGRYAGHLQKDDFAEHDHAAKGVGQGVMMTPFAGGQMIIPTDATTGLRGGKETRPKNVAVFYYIKIN